MRTPFLSVRLVLSILFAVSAPFGASASTTSFSAQQEDLLLELKAKTISLVEKQKYEAEKLRKCFAFQAVCDSDLQKQLPLIRKAIVQKSEEYRLLVGLARLDARGPLPLSTARLSMSLPSVYFAPLSQRENSETDLLKKIQREDYSVIETNAKTAYAHTRAETLPYVDVAGYIIANELQNARHFYEMQAFLIIHQVPFVIYLSSDRPNDNEIAKALGKYIQRVHEALNDLYDDAKNPLESFLIYQPIVNSVIEESPQKKLIVDSLLASQKHKVGMKAWIERNSPSMKLFAFSSCSLVAAVLQAWPVSLACGGTVAAITSKQLYDDYNRMKDDFALWLTGVQSHEAVKGSEARVLYSSMALFFAGQSVSTTIIAIETSLISTLSNLPSVAAARFTSLTALREGGLRFASRTIEMKGKDLGASIFAGSYVNITDQTLVTSRGERIFTYKDLLSLKDLSLHKK